MLLALIGSYRWIVANWRLTAIGAVLASSFMAGFYVRGSIAEAAQNKAIAAAVQKTKDEEKSLYEKAKIIEAIKRKSREKARADANRLEEGLIDSECLDAPLIPAEWVRIRDEAIADRAGKP